MVRRSARRDEVYAQQTRFTLSDHLVLRHCRRLRQRAGARDVETDAVDARLRGELEHAAVGIAPSHIVRVLGAAQRAEVFAVRVENPKSTGAADI